MSREMKKLTCPNCGQNMIFIGSAGIVDYDGDWDAQADRYDCPEGHTVFVVDTDRLDPEK